MRAFVPFALAAIRWGVAAALLVMMIITCLDVIGRYVINRPFPGAAELVQYLMITAIFLALPAVTLRGEHISISLIDSMLGAGWRRLQRVLVSLASAAVLAVLCQRFWIHGQMLAGNRDVIGFLNLPVAPAAFLASVLCGVTVLTLCVMALLDALGRAPLAAADSGQGGGKLE